MINFILEKPVAFIVFNRPHTTKRVFEVIRSAKPPILLVIADGPRNNRQGEIDKCQAVRDIIDTVDWPCRVLKNFSDINLGCRRRVSSGITWVFDHVEDAIILEDDCLPDPSFFYFCQEMLERYKNDPRIMHICGCNFQDGYIHGDGSYYFSKFSHIWGWASWRRAWRHYDVAMTSFPSFKEQGQIQNIFPNKNTHKDWLSKLQAVYSGEIDTWDLQWMYTVWIQNGLSIIPNVNMISNIGFGPDATHTKVNTNLSNINRYRIEEIKQPSFILACKKADDYTNVNQFSISIAKRISLKFKHIMKMVAE